MKESAPQHISALIEKYLPKMLNEDISKTKKKEGQQLLLFPKKSSKEK
jgi:hypothetical protein